jgi:RHS repeat-associated protein
VVGLYRHLPAAVGPARPNPGVGLLGRYPHPRAAPSRLSFLADDDGSGGIGAILEAYSYLGLSTVVLRAHPESGVDLTYIRQPNDPVANTDGGDQYTGLDRFGRVIDQFWVSEADGSSTDRFQYGYDRDGNRLYQANLVTEAIPLPFDELYRYDSLNQLTSSGRGILNATRDGFVRSPTHSQDWNLDALGNWNAVTTDGTTQGRDHNAQNQIIDVNGTPLGYDNNGNTTTDENGQVYVYDAWNRLVQAQDGNGNQLASYAYDALGRRIQENENDAFGNPVTRDLYYSSRWQVLEERETDSFGNTLVRAQNVWSPVYVDALVLRNRDPAPAGSGSLSERLYVQQNANWNVTAIVDTTGTVQERYVYDAYGKPTVLAPDWTAQTKGSQFGWVYLHQGGRLDSATGLYSFRHRDDSPTLGRWMQQDPLGYVDSMNVYEYLRDNPTNLLDPQGTWLLWLVPVVEAVAAIACKAKLSADQAEAARVRIKELRKLFDEHLHDGHGLKAILEEIKWWQGQGINAAVEFGMSLKEIEDIAHAAGAVIR